MHTYSALTTLEGREPAEALGRAMEALTPEPTGVGVCEIEDGSGRWEVGAYFVEPPDLAGLELLRVIHDAAPFAVSKVPEIDWVAHVRRELRPVEAGRFFVYGSHDADKVPSGAVALLIEAAMAFGTGHHATTRGCLLALDRLDRAGVRARNVADIGCGTAVLAMAAATIWSGAVLASDIDAVAVDVAQSNVAANGLTDRVTCLEAAGFDHPAIQAASPFDLVFANILKGPLIEMAPDMARHVAPSGRAILAGILNGQADQVVTAYVAAGFDVETRDEMGEWTILVLLRGQ